MDKKLQEKNYWIISKQLKKSDDQKAKAEKEWSEYIDWEIENERTLLSLYIERLDS